MLNKDNAAVLIGMGAIIATIGIGTCSTNQRMDDGFAEVNRRIDDVHRRIDDGVNSLQRQIDDTNRRIDDTNQRMNEGFASVNRRIDEVQNDIREIRTMLFETLKNQAPAN